MAGLTSTFHHPCKSNLCKPLKPLSFHLRIFSLRISAPTTGGCLSNSTIRTTISARYGRGGTFQRSQPSYEDDDDDEALDISSISSDTVRLIDEQQKMVGIIPKDQAVQMANDAKLQLVILSPDADPPVVKIMNYDKYRYKLQKKTRDQQKKTGRMELKELKMGHENLIFHIPDSLYPSGSYNIDVHDYSVRLKAAQKFLKDGDKVKVIVNLKGREKEFRNNAIELVRRFQSDVGELAVEEAKDFRQKNIFMILSPNKAVVQKPREPPKKNDNAVANEVSASVN
ncbi:translation initiation factor IF-3 [Striga asiatica]|uniref:Translation initiation factor IF-3 n=1 Tax=Striga asiatica TaxID=4170 RepID=A0A5A7R4D9_STRAF|nr:translation initiation factor IF-3 [Striga asiatica]